MIGINEAINETIKEAVGQVQMELQKRIVSLLSVGLKGEEIAEIFSLCRMAAMTTQPNTMYYLDKVISIIIQAKAKGEPYENILHDLRGTARPGAQREPDQPEI